MRIIRRVGGLAVAGFLLSGFVSGPATAATTSTSTPESFIGSAAGAALVLSVAGNGVSSGISSAKLDSSAKAVADSAGLLGLPVLGGSNAGTATVAGAPGTDSKAGCATPSALQGLGGILSLGVACSSSMAEITQAGPHALATGNVVGIDVTAQSLLNTTLGNPGLAPVINGLLGGLDTLNKSIPGSPDLKIDDTLSNLLTKLETTQTLAIKLGNSTSETTTAGATVTSVANAQAGVIQILPIGATVTDATGGLVQLKPVVEILIGSAQAKAVYDRASGVSTPSFDPSIVTVRINTPTTDALGKIIGQNLSEIKIAPNLSPATIPAPAAAIAAPCADASNEFCILAGTPLETRIAVASGRTITNADGSVGAVADAVKIHALKNIGATVAPLTGGILLELGHAEAGVGGKPGSTTTVNLPDIPNELPRTGGTPWLPIAGALVLGLAFLTRRTLVRAR